MRLDPKIREEQILAAALNVAKVVGYSNVTREEAAHEAGVSPALISVRLGTMANFRRKLMRYAVRMKCLPVIAQGLAARDPYAQKAPAELKQKALAAL
jgi:AcrR family transcriptional regulator